MILYITNCEVYSTLICSLENKKYKTYFVLLKAMFYESSDRFYLQIKKASVEETSKVSGVSDLRVGSLADFGHRSLTKLHVIKFRHYKVGAK